MTKKFFFMAAISAALQGRPQVQFNTITSLNDRNISARSLDMIQNAAAEMIAGQVDYDDLVIQNVFCLTPDGMTEEEFVAGTQLADQLNARRAAEAQATAQPDPAAANAEALNQDDQQPAPESTTIGTVSDLSELDAQAVEATPVDDVTTADVQGSGSDRDEDAGR